MAFKCMKTLMMVQLGPLSASLSNFPQELQVTKDSIPFIFGLNPRSPSGLHLLNSDFRCNTIDSGNGGAAYANSILLPTVVPHNFGEFFPPPLLLRSDSFATRCVLKETWRTSIKIYQLSYSSTPPPRCLNFRLRRMKSTSETATGNDDQCKECEQLQCIPCGRTCTQCDGEVRVILQGVGETRQVQNDVRSIDRIGNRSGLTIYHSILQEVDVVLIAFEDCRT